MKKRRKLPITCPSCKGKGKLVSQFPPQTRDGKVVTVEHICPTCEGYGVVRR